MKQGRYDKLRDSIAITLFGGCMYIIMVDIDHLLDLMIRCNS